MPNCQMDKPKWTDIAVVLLAACSVVPALLQWHVYRKQAAEMRLQTAEMEASGKQTDRLIQIAQASSDNAAKSSAAAIKSAEAESRLSASSENSVTQTAKVAGASLSAATLAQKEGQEDRRAWIALQAGELMQFEADKKVILHFDVHNFERSPALSTAVATVAFPVYPVPTNPAQLQVFYSFVEKNLPKYKAMDEYRNAQPFTPIPPNGTLDYSTPDAPVISPETYSAVEQGTQRLFFPTRIVYTDAQGIKRETVTCDYVLMLDGKPELILAPFGNEMN